MVVCENGEAGLNFEHSRVDGHTVLRLASDIFADSVIRFAASVTAAVHGSRSPLAKASLFDINLPNDSCPYLMKSLPRKLDWNMNKSLLKSISAAEAHLSDLISQSDTDILEFTNYGN